MIWFVVLALWLAVAGTAGYLLLSEDRIRWLAGQRGYPEPGLMLVAIAGGAGGMVPVLTDIRFAPARRRLKRCVWFVTGVEVIALLLLGWIGVTTA